MQTYIFNSHPSSNPPDIIAPKKTTPMNEKHGKETSESNTVDFVWFQYITEAEKQMTLVPATWVWYRQKVNGLHHEVVPGSMHKPYLSGREYMHIQRRLLK